MGSLFGTYCQQLRVSRCGPGAQGFCLDFVSFLFITRYAYAQGRVKRESVYKLYRLDDGFEVSTDLDHITAETDIICSAQTVDLDHPWIACAKRGLSLLKACMDVGQTVDSYC